MPRSSNAWSSRHSAALEHLWGTYRTWAATARQQKQEITAYQVRILVLTILGAVLGMLSQQFGGVLEVVAAAAGATSIALAGYFAKEVLSWKSENRWVRARSIAEALKSESYLFRTGVPPYDTPDAPSTLLSRIAELLTSADDLEAVTVSAEKLRERLPEGPLDIAGYLSERVDDQIDNFYVPRAEAYGKLLERSRRATLGLGAAAIVLGGLSTVGWAAGWIAVVAATTAAIGAYVHRGRYQYLVVSYQATTRKLSLLKTSWHVSAADQRDFSTIVLQCEDVISVENTAWMSRWIEGDRSGVAANTREG